jgi:hypothetical protein
MSWADGSLILYHGCDNGSADDIARQIKWNCGDPLTDFGLGFYTTTSLHQAKNWANNRCTSKIMNDPSKAVFATVLRFELPRDKMDGLSMLSFVLESSNQDYWDFVSYCRAGNTPHRPNKNGGENYDVVVGPVSLWPYTLTLANPLLLYV